MLFAEAKEAIPTTLLVSLHALVLNLCIFVGVSF